MPSAALKCAPPGVSFLGSGVSSLRDWSFIPTGLESLPQEDHFAKVLEKWCRHHCRIYVRGQRRIAVDRSLPSGRDNLLTEVYLVLVAKQTSDDKGDGGDGSPAKGTHQDEGLTASLHGLITDVSSQAAEAATDFICSHNGLFLLGY